MKKLLQALLLFSFAANASHTVDRKVYATDITNKSGTPIFKFPTTLPTASRVSLFNSDGEITSSGISDTTLGYLDATSSIQTQLDAKDAILSFTAPLIRTTNTMTCRSATGSDSGCLSSTDWNTFNGKQNSLTIGDLTAAGTDGIVITGGTGAIIGAGTSLAQHVADASHNGYVTSTDWSTFNGKQAGDSDLTTIAGLTATTDSFLQSKASAWTTRTISQVKTDLGLTGTNSGDQTITLTSDVTGSGTGSFATTIANDAVTYAKMQNVSAASRLLGRGSAGGSGDPEEITISTGLSLSGTTLTATGTGDVTGPASSTANALALFSGTGGKTLKNQTSMTTDSTLTFLGINGITPVSYFQINEAAATATPNMAHFTHGTQTGTSTVNGVIMGYPSANSSAFTIKQQASARININVAGTDRIWADASAINLTGTTGTSEMYIDGTGIGINNSQASQAQNRFYIAQSIGMGKGNASSNATLTSASGSVQSYDPTNGNVTTILNNTTSNYAARFNMWFRQDVSDSNNIWTLDPPSALLFNGQSTATLESKYDGIVSFLDNSGNSYAVADGRAPGVVAITANYTALDNRKIYILICDPTSNGGDATVTPYTSVGHKGYTIKLKNIGTANNCIFNPNSTETVDTNLTDTIAPGGMISREYIADGTGWYIF